MTDKSGLISFENRVAKGAKWMDSVYPQWTTKVKLADVDLELHKDCVLGQVFDEIVSEKLCEKGEFSNDHGFSLRGKEFKRSNWIKLSSLWAAEVEKRIKK